ncbi:MAG: tyrosine-type recombinase/integrase [Planctomycetota bacterium]
MAVSGNPPAGPSGTPGNHQTHPRLWNLAYDAAMEDVVAMTRATAGTDAMLVDPLRYLRMATKADAWVRSRGEVLFKTIASVTLRNFYEQYYLPQCMAPDACDGYKLQFEVVLRRWELVTGDPGIQAIDNELLVKFRDFLTKMPGKEPGTTLSPNSVRRFLTYTQRLLDHAGPPGRRLRSAAGILTSVPWTKPPRVILHTPRTVALETVIKVYQAAKKMRVPKLPGVAAADWWRTLIVTVLYTGLRRRTLFELEMGDIDWSRKLLDIPPERLKARRGDVVHLNPIAFEHLERIRTDRVKVFGHTWGKRTFHDAFHRLQDLAGIPRQAQFGLLILRKTFGSLMVEHSPEAARLALGHTLFRTSEKHYVQATGFVAEGIDKLPQPNAFRASGNGDQEE